MVFLGTYVPRRLCKLSLLGGLRRATQCPFDVNFFPMLVSRGCIACSENPPVAGSLCRGPVRTFQDLNQTILKQTE